MGCREHVACSRQLDGGGNGKLLSEHVVGRTSRFFYDDHGLVYFHSTKIL